MLELTIMYRISGKLGFGHMDITYNKINDYLDEIDYPCEVVNGSTDTDFIRDLLMEHLPIWKNKYLVEFKDMTVFSVRHLEMKEVA